MSSRNWNQSTAALKIRLKQAVDAGRPLWVRPWIAPTAWTSGQTVQVGEVRKNSATPAQWYIAIAQGGVCGATEPSQTNGSAAWDGTANASVLWTHLGGAADWADADDPAKPTVTIGTTSTPSGLTALDVWANRSLFTLNGYYGAQYNTSNIRLKVFDSKSGTTKSGGGSVAFWSDAPKIGFKPLGGNEGARVFVDGRPITVDPINVNTGNSTWFTVDWGVRKPRLWELVYGKQDSYFQTIAITSADQVWAAPRQIAMRGVFVGDSYLDGSSYGPFLLGNTLSAHFGRLIGIDDMWRFGVGGTGLLNPGSGPFYTYRERVPELLSQSPNVIFVQGSTNDASYTQAAITTEALAFLDAIRAGTSAPVFWFGPAPLSGSYSAIQTVDTALAVAVAARPNSNIFYKSMVTATPPWLTGSHNNANYNWSSNFAQYIGGDNTHPVDKGTIYLAQRMASAYANEMLPLVA